MGTKLNVGDRVRLITNGGYGPDELYFAGAEGTVIEDRTDVNDNLYGVLVDGEDSYEYPGGLGFFLGKEMVLIEPDDAQFNKADAGKIDPAILEVDALLGLEMIQAVLEYGKAKYERAGWKKVEGERYDAAMRRHRRARDKGEVLDPESGLPHLAHEVCNGLFLLQFMAEAAPAGTFTEFNEPPRDHRK